ncbi:hypothetical protein [Sabulibacter ruber]|uniref:hypothetical protein n=1 Tax=Sabulibacter ruber TaxID=2811901 RepID=UPI001A965109|nr:hypothetical protein [Sabulibacter ruber]
MEKRRIFIFAYYSLLDPIFQSAVLPYFKNVGPANNIEFVLLTFEQSKYKLNRSESLKYLEELKQDNIIWYQTNWRSGRFKIFKKVFDFIWGFVFAGFLCYRYKVKAVYTEGFPGAVISHYLSKFFKVPHLVHTFEPHADYMIEAGVWTSGSWEAKFLKKYEIIVAKGASYIFTATDAMISKLRHLGVSGNIFRVPSCVDTEVFKFSQFHRDEVRKLLGVKDDECLITYLGKFGGMYMDEEIFEFMASCIKFSLNKIKFLVITPDSHSHVYQSLDLNGIEKSKVTVLTLKRNEISAYLSASDFGLVPVRQNPSKRFCSPIKDGEYWACGLPIIIPRGISDDYLFAKDKKIGIVLDEPCESSYIKVIKEVDFWLKNEPKNSIVDRCRSFAISDRDIKPYKNLYSEIFLKL